MPDGEPLESSHVGRHPVLSRNARRRWPVASTRCYLSWSAFRSFFSLLIAGLIVYYAVKYAAASATAVGAGDRRRPAAGDRVVGDPVPHLDGDFRVGRQRLSSRSRPPDETLDIYVVGKQWMWKFQHLDGQREINELHVPARPPGQADDDVRGRDSRCLRPAFRVKARRRAGPLHAPVVRADQGRAAITCSAPSIAARATPG